MKNVYCVLVDAYRSGKLYAPKLKDIGVICIHINSNPNPNDESNRLLRRTLEKTGFLLEIDYNNNDDEIINAVAAYNPVCVVACLDSGVRLADLIGTKLGLHSNNAATTEMRLNKYKMHERLKQCGISYIKSYKSSNLSDFIEAFKDIFIGGPVVVKPTNSAGTDSVYFCNNENEVAAAFNRIIHTYNKLSYLNDEVLMQEYVEGDEHIVNAITFQGKHIITDIWESTRIKKGGLFIHDYVKLLPHKGKTQNDLVEYSKNVLDALGFEFGVSHSELIMTKHGPVLLELNPRLTGGYLSEIAYSCIGECSVSYFVKLVSSIVAQDSFSVDETGYILKNNACLVELISNKQGIVKAYNNIDKIEALESFFRMDLGVKVGDEIKTTTDAWTSPGLVFLVHPDEETVMKNCADVRMIENEMFLV
jgi:carbamoylphosphate synthase large subunit